MVVPFEVALEGLVAAYIGNATARLLHGVHGGLVQPSGLFQAQLPLHPGQGLGGGPMGLCVATPLEHVHVAKAVQVSLEAQ